MLVLSRRPGERIFIDDHIEVTVVQVRGNRVKLGVTCDRSIPIRREELPMLDSKKKAAAVASESA